MLLFWITSYRVRNLWAFLLTGSQVLTTDRSSIARRGARSRDTAGGRWPQREEWSNPGEQTMKNLNNWRRWAQLLHGGCPGVLSAYVWSWQTVLFRLQELSLLWKSNLGAFTILQPSLDRVLLTILKPFSILSGHQSAEYMRNLQTIRKVLTESLLLMQSMAAWSLKFQVYTAAQFSAPSRTEIREMIS